MTLIGGTIHEHCTNRWGNARLFNILFNVSLWL